MFEDYTVKELTLSLNEPFRPNGDMALEDPTQGEYSYYLTVSGDGNAAISSSFYGEVKFTEERLEELKALLQDGTAAE